MQKFLIGKLQKFPIWKIPSISHSENSKNFQFGKFRKFPIRKIPKCPIWKFGKKFQSNKLSYILGVSIIPTNKKKLKKKTNSKIKKSNNWSFVILIFKISQFRNIGRFYIRSFQILTPAPQKYTPIQDPINLTLKNSALM